MQFDRAIVMGLKARLDSAIIGVCLRPMRPAADDRPIATFRIRKGAGRSVAFAAAIIFELGNSDAGIAHPAGIAIRRCVVVHPVAGNPDLAALVMNVIGG